MFFTKLEGWFELQGIGTRKEHEKNTAVITYADPKYLEQVHDLVVNEPTSNPYTTLKQSILVKFAESEMARLDKLATGIQLGDGRLLSQLQQTNATNDESVVRHYWIKRLPPSARAVIVGILQSAPNTPISQLATTADAVIDSLNYSGDNIQAVTSINSEDTSLATRMSRLEKRIDDQDKCLQEISKKLSQSLNNNNRRSRSRSSSNQRNTSQQNNANQYCWYHKYGSSAQHCQAPCNFKSNNNGTKN
ncbi:uncharacterized protein Dmoj_GI17106 [Drosophila mojavensis]|uniref:DUF7041 domain-containing protein n=1 Tax=Drosophila mojavensis TaxID=7230 RepID=B4LAR1_DROMO|nr:uncharacterized protein Dmoj_GI17106 [Drosophila mojavensis]